MIKEFANIEENIFILETLSNIKGRKTKMRFLRMMKVKCT